METSAEGGLASGAVVLQHERVQSMVPSAAVSSAATTTAAKAVAKVKAAARR